MPTYISGDDSILSIHDGTAYRPVACLTSNSLQSTLEVKETINKCVPGAVQKTVGAMSYSISVDGEYVDTTSAGGDTALASHDFLFQKQSSGEYVTWKLTNGTVASQYGTALITDLSKEAPAGENMTFSATLDGSGLIVEVDPEA